MSQPVPEAAYINGHHESVLRSHNWRTVENSAAYLLKSIRPDMHVLDVGCGPGSITIDFARLVPQGHAVGIENTSDVLAEARTSASAQGITNVEFRIGDALALDFPDGTFDVVHAHQVLQHVPDPVLVLSEMRRVTKPGGFVAVRQGNFGNMSFFPEDPVLDEWKETHMAVTRALGGEPSAGCRLVSWAMQAGFPRETITTTASAWCYSTPEERAWWGNLWADRVQLSAFATKAVKGGFATQEKLDMFSQAFRQWMQQEDGWYALLHGEILCRV
ncbi:predicted protein [Postia placenta Mad-698-R]|uniref:Methyltransferase domain-containing protein n=1 Tax=Postia placenta MAD-698-R-SB12 TaxID=670580 RepID=A0A1X6NB13_9APHY|nr:hypothetical protein POSPLADRAFT_1052435 [Postia placenta MAD-698-R-SB12]EED82032.1 predicted protein [Postia placenta Mad-698-R]OSX65764.1 hypothetical protein POSPLADRAFT_1052435 [Postia placenta MAD-698-R-SB12]